MGTAVVIGITGLSVGAMYFILASGLSLIFGLMDVLSFAHGAYLAVAAYASWLIMREAPGTPGTGRLLVVVLVAIAVGALLGLLTEVLLIRPLYARTHYDQLLMTTGLAFVLTGVLHGLFGADSQAFKVPAWLQNGPELFGARITNDRILIIVSAALLFIGTELFLKYTRFGLTVRAGVENRDMVRALGIDVRRSFTLIFTLGGAFAGFGGALAATYGRALTVDIGNNYLLFAFIVLVIGGLGSLRGALVAALLIGLIQQYANFYINLGLGEVLVVALMAVLLLVRPQGLFGLKERMV